MIHGTYISILDDIYSNYRNKYFQNKPLLKDTGSKTIQSFMQNFMEFSYLSQIKNSITYDNFKDFVNSFFKEFKHIKIGQSSSDLRSLVDKEYTYEESTSNSELGDKNIDERFYLKLFFFENCLIVFKSSDEGSKYQEILNHFFNVLIQNFSVEDIYQQIHIFKFYLKNVILFCLKSVEGDLTISTLYDSLNILVTNESKNTLISFIFMCSLLSLSTNKHHNIVLFDEQFNLIIKVLHEKATPYIELVLKIKESLNLHLPNISENASVKIENSLLLLFQKMLVKVKSEKLHKLETSHEFIIEKFLVILNEKNFKEIDGLDKLVFVFQQILYSLTNENLKHELEFKRRKLLFEVMKSNQPVFHKLSVSFLSKIREFKLIDNLFLDKFISVFDVLDGYNSHLFKSLWKDLEKVILTCEHFSSQQFISSDNFLFEIGKDKSLEQVFNNPFNYFSILTKKIKNHQNARIQKFFIKSFSNLCIKENLHNPNFDNFAFDTLVKMLDNPLFYPENESISYHAKIGLVAESFYSSWLQNNIEQYLPIYLKSLVDNVTFKRVFVYLFNAINNALTKSDIKYQISDNISESICKMLELSIKYLPIYQKQKCWETIALIYLQSNCIPNLTINICNIFDVFINNFIKDNFKYMSIENINLMDNKNIIRFNSFISLFLNVFCNFKFSEIDFNNGVTKLCSNLRTALKSQECHIISDRTLTTIFWFVVIWNSDKFYIFDDFTKSISNLFSAYIQNEEKSALVGNILIILQLLELYFIFVGNNNNENAHFRYLNSLTETYKLIYESFGNSFTTYMKFLASNKDNDAGYLSDEHLFTISHLKVYEEITQRMFSIESKYNESLIVKQFNFFTTEDVTLLLINTSSSNSNSNFTNKEINISLNETKIKMLHFITSYIKVNSINALHSYDINNNLVQKIFSSSANKNQSYHSFYSMILFLNKIEDLLESDKTWLKDNKTKESYNEIYFNIIKVKTLTLLLAEKLQDSNSNWRGLINIIFIDNPNNYALKIVDSLDKSNEEDIYYIFKILSCYIRFYPDLDYDFISLYIKSGLKTIIEKRENLNYSNTSTFLSSFLNAEVLTNYYNKFQNLELISESLKNLCDLNEKRTWLVLKISSDLIMNIITLNPKLIGPLKEHILNLAESKETRGEDTFMLQTSPHYLYSPFNIDAHKICENNSISEEEYKYGLYVRLKLMNFFDTTIKEGNNDSDGITIPILQLIENILIILDNNSSHKAEMQFTTKHRRKLRLSQFLLILSQIFNKIENTNELATNISNIEKLMKTVFEKVNLYSVRFYFDLCCLNFAMTSHSFLQYLISVLSDPKAKTHCVTSSLIILSIMLIHYKEGEIKTLNTETAKDIYEKIASLCTSNICNIRGFAQYFLYRIREENLSLSHSVQISELFYTYLSKNVNIQRFFNKFNQNYSRYTELVRKCNVENILQNNFDEVNCEIMPSDFIKEFKEMALQMVNLEGQDLTKQHIAWQDFAADEQNILTEIANQDFQKKYRPLEENSKTNKKRKRLDVVVMASLIDKAPNLGGLARTCEVFNLGAMTICSETFLNDNAFLTAASSAERWLPLINLPNSDIELFIQSYRKLGYLIVGLEQTANSVSLKDFEFKEKCVIVLGNEKEGIPQSLIGLIDVCVVIPQFGEVRSLNVHVSAALMLWELVNKCSHANK